MEAKRWGVDPDIIFKWFSDAIKPDPVLTVSEWADRHRILSKKAASEAGPWRTDRTPYLREVMDSLSVFHPAKRIVFKKAAQIGATEAGNNWVGYVIANAPGPMMLVLPTVDLARRNSKLRVDPLIEESPILKNKVSAPRAKQSSNTINQKDFDGGTLVITGANSAPGLRSMPARFVMLDEVDAYPRDVEGEGDPVSLALARSRTFARSKAFLISTPTLEGFSKIHEEFEESDKRFYYVPCPDCGTYQTLKFEMLKWDEGKPKTAMYCCESCGVLISEGHKTDMLARGKWIAENPGHETVGFFINSLYSPLGWYSWADAAREYEAAKKEYETLKKTEKLRTFYNTVLGLVYTEPGESPEWQRIYERRDNYSIGSVPLNFEDVFALTCGVDIQRDRIEAEVVAWGKNKASWSVEYVVFPGSTVNEEVWAELEFFLDRTYKTLDGRDLKIKGIGIDSGYETQKVYNFCRKFSPNRVFAMKGMEHLTVSVGAPRAVDVKIKGRIIKRRAVKVWPVGVSILKTELYSWLKLDPPEGDHVPSGYCHFPEYDSEYFKQLTAEKLVTRRNRRGYVVQEWVKDRDRNEALDCRVYARATAALVGLDRLKHVEPVKAAQQETLASDSEPVHNVNQTRKKPKRILRRRSEGSSVWG